MSTPVTRSSLIPVLGFIALALFGANFYKYVSAQETPFLRGKACLGADAAFFIHEVEEEIAFALPSFEAEFREIRREAERCRRKASRIRAEHRVLIPAMPRPPAVAVLP